MKNDRQCHKKVKHNKNKKQLDALNDLFHAPEDVDQISAASKHWFKSGWVEINEEWSGGPGVTQSDYDIGDRGPLVKD